MCISGPLLFSTKIVGFIMSSGIGTWDWMEERGGRERKFHRYSYEICYAIEPCVNFVLDLYYSPSSSCQF